MRSISGSFAALALLATAVQATPVMRMPAHMRVKRQDHAATQTGEMTFYNTGMTACGQVKSDGEKVAAVSKLYFDSYPGATANPNANPLCGQKATVTNPATGQSVVVEIWDRCDGCAFGDIDLTPGAFDLIASENDGRIPGVTWQLGEGAPQPPPETQPPPPETTQAPPPPETTQAPPPPETTMAPPPPETTTAPPPPETTAPPVEDPCPPEDPEEPPVTTTPEDPCPPEDPEEPPVTPEDPCPPEDPETPPTTPEDPCPPEGDGEGEGDGETTTPPPDTNTGSAAAWDASKVYVGGDPACYSGTLYKAKWWTQGEQPPSQVWAEDGKC